jgi:SAM-dependent methyltransferase
VPDGGAQAYWEDVVSDWQQTPVHQLWRLHSDAINTSLIDRWLPERGGRVLKTDLFDEAVGHGIYPALSPRYAEVCGVDIAPAAVARAVTRYPNLQGRVADIRQLPYRDESFDTVFSNSTLDHFASPAEIEAGLREIVRTLRPGGMLLITLDNRTNPIIALRTSQLLRPVQGARFVPYFLGATLGRRGLHRVLKQAGLNLCASTVVMHCPPQLAAALQVRFGRRGADPSGHLHRVLSFEVLERHGLRSLTGHFVAALAVKPGRARARP